MLMYFPYSVVYCGIKVKADNNTIYRTKYDDKSAVAVWAMLSIFMPHVGRETVVCTGLLIH